MLLESNTFDLFERISYKNFNTFKKLPDNSGYVYITHKSEVFIEADQKTNYKKLFSDSYGKFNIIIFGDFRKFYNNYIKFAEINDNTSAKAHRFKLNSKQFTLLSYNKQSQSFIRKLCTYKQWNSILLPLEQKQRIDNCIKHFFDSHELFNKYGWSYKLNILLTGPSGTGKSSIAKIIMSTYLKTAGRKINQSIVEKYYHKNTTKAYFDIFSDMYVINANNIEEEFSLVVEKTHQNKEDLQMILIEEIDEIMNYPKSREYLMQILDGPLSQNNTIVICTTNYPEKLDKRILDRFNLKEYIDKMDFETACRLCKRFNLSNKEIAEILKEQQNDDDFDGKYVPRRIENAIKCKLSMAFSDSDFVSKNEEL